MPYFRELPNIQYPSIFGDRVNIDEYVEAKNIFRRPKLRTDIANAITGFTYYQIRDGERPDQIAEKFYGNSELDWVVLITNNITNLYSEWPLDNDSLYKYMIEKYGSEEELAKIRHYETVEYTDEYNRVIIQGGLTVDVGKTEVIDTNTSSNSYPLESFPSSKGNTVISINLNQRISIKGRDVQEKYNITDINTNTSNLKIKNQDETKDDIDITVLNSLASWPSGWGGILKVYMRGGDTYDVAVEDIILDNKVRIPERLYEITGTLDANGVLQPTFNFTNEIPA